ncbi:MAG: hypothetical protein M1320_00160 [Patescibacteria group bacterium]|nr:hypothetical protein [Patescibacteria group bacterium]
MAKQTSIQKTKGQREQKMEDILATSLRDTEKQKTKRNNNKQPALFLSILVG